MPSLSTESVMHCIGLMTVANESTACQLSVWVGLSSFHKRQKPEDVLRAMLALW
jgi:hypothetical protein